MKFESINSLILILAAVAVVVRLVLVIFKLRQNIEAAMSQLTHQGYQFSSQVGFQLWVKIPLRYSRKLEDA